MDEVEDTLQPKNNQNDDLTTYVVLSTFTRNMSAVSLVVVFGLGCSAGCAGFAADDGDVHHVVAVCYVEGRVCAQELLSVPLAVVDHCGG